MTSASRSWLSVSTVALASFILITSEFLPVGFLQRLSSAFNVAPGTAGMMVTVPGIVAAIAAPLAAVAAGRTNRRLVLSASLFFVTLSNIVVAMAPTVSTALIGRAFLGVAVGTFWSFCIAVARRLVHDQSGHRATAVVLVGVSAGTVVGVPAGSALATMLGWRSAFSVAAAASCMILVVLRLVLPSLPGERSTSLRSFGSLFQKRPLVMGYIAMALSAAGHFASYTYLQPLLLERAHFGNAGVIWTLLAYGLAGSVGTFMGERLAVHHLQRALVVVVLGMSAATVLLTAHTRSTLTFFLVILWGTAFGALPVCTQLWIHRAAPFQFEAASSIGMTVFQLSLAFGSFSGGVAFDIFGLVAAFLLGSCLLAFCGIVVSAFSGPLPGKHEAELLHVAS